MKKFNNKGFTLVEIIAVVAVMGVLSGTAVVGVSSSIKKSHDEYCTSIVDMMTLAGRDYFQDNRSKLPLSIEKEESVSLKDLIDQKYIDPIKDYDDNDCPIDEDNKVKVQKQFGNDYYYTTYLKCNKCSTSNTNPENISTPSITFSPNGGNYKNKDVNVTVNITDQKNDITSYEYEIQKKQDNGSYTSIKKVTKGNVNDKNVTFNVKLNSKGTYKVKVTAFNSVFRKKEGTSKEYILDYTLNCNKQLTISAQVDDKNIQEKTWYNGEMKFKVSVKGAVDRYDVYIDGQKMNSNFLTKDTTYTKGREQTAIHKIEVKAYDDQGNSCPKSAEYWQDNDPPTCSSNDSSNKWYNEDVTLPITCTDGDPSHPERPQSGCKDNNATFTANQEGTYTQVVNVFDKAGNVGQCSVTINVDKTPPTCSVALSGNLGNYDDVGKFYYYKGRDAVVNATLITNDTGGSGIQKWGISDADTTVYNNSNNITFSARSQYPLFPKFMAYGYVMDNAGNSGKCTSPYAFKIDAFLPSCSIVINGTNINNFFKDSAEVTFEIQEAGSGISVSKCKDGDTSIKCAPKNYTSSFKKKTISTYLQDNAGNENSCKADFSVDADYPYLDYKKEVIKKIDNKSVNVAKKGNCKNSNSGCMKPPSNVDCFNYTTKGSTICIDKLYACGGGYEFVAKDATSSAKITNELLTHIGEIKDTEYYEIDNTQYTIEDSVGHTSKVLVSILNSHHYRHLNNIKDNVVDSVKHYGGKYECTKNGWVVKK